MITAKWTGEYPNMCSGKWIITINGTEIKCNKPYYDSILGQSMDTYGNYDSWEFTDDWDVQWGSRTEGEHFSRWKNLDSTKQLLKLIEDNGVELSSFSVSDLYNVLQENDWRSSSCGGCI